MLRVATTSRGFGVGRSYVRFVAERNMMSEHHFPKKLSADRLDAQGSHHQILQRCSPGGVLCTTAHGAEDAAGQRWLTEARCQAFSEHSVNTS